MKDIKTNSGFDDRFKEIEVTLDHFPIVSDFEFIYDASKRLINKHGLSITFIEKLYIIGLVNGIRNERSKKKVT